MMTTHIQWGNGSLAVTTYQDLGNKVSVSVEAILVMLVFVMVNNLKLQILKI